ncbi:MAG: phage regulatory CII family protein [Tepidisphaeraceae bacterium]
MKSYEVIRQAVEEPGVKAVAAALKVSAALVYKWCEPPADETDPEQSGAKNPLDRMSEMYHVTQDIRLVRWLCNQAGGFYVTNPAPVAEKNIDAALYRQTRSLVRDFSELLDSVTESVEDDHQVDLDEADKIRQRWEELKANVENFVVLCEKGHFLNRGRK